MKSITTQELNKIIQDPSQTNYIVVDVRTKPEYNQINIQEAINIPLQEIPNHQQELQKYKTVYIHCQSGGRSQKACQMLANLQGVEVINIQGGILDWEAQKFPTNKSQKTGYSIIQQVHIIAGSLALISSILSQTVASEWIYLSSLIGAGLLFAGLSGWCGMAHLLQKMPWNK